MKQLKDFKNIHKGESILVCGCGMSIKDLKRPEKYITIGVNDIGRLFHPTYLVVVDDPQKFPGIRGDVVIKTKSKYLFTQVKKWKIENMEKLVLFKLGSNSQLKNLDNDDILDYSNTSTYVAIILAYKMGVKEIGLIGVDFTENHFYEKDGVYILVKKKLFNNIKNAYHNLMVKLNEKNVKVFNLSKNSKLDSIPKMDLNEFIKKIETVD